ncbi:MAG: imidazole glycerol phosphate synthase subunit HisH [Bacteroidales bacterium]|nr:imidazole glycerol phosphate synthase subunit HisH [Bacteroidales bacterium]
MIAIVDYSTGNIRSVINAMKRIGAEDVVLTSDAAIIASADRVILPGVGDASASMSALREKGLDKCVKALHQPVLGICVGMQLMSARSEEGDVECMGIFETCVRRFEPQPGLKIPHMGWNSINELKSPLFAGLAGGEYVYYVHSYRPDICRDTICRTDYGGEFSGALRRENFYGTQFHPEKSGSIGEIILKNFIAL